MTISRQNLVDDMRQVFRRHLDKGFAAVVEHYSMIDGALVAREIAIVALLWGWDKLGETIKGRLRE